MRFLDETLSENPSELGKPSQIESKWLQNTPDSSKTPENEVLSRDIHFETDLNPKNHEKSPKSRENCPLGLGHRVHQGLIHLP